MRLSNTSPAAYHAKKTNTHKQGVNSKIDSARPRRKSLQNHENNTNKLFIGGIPPDTNEGKFPKINPL